MITQILYHLKPGDPKRGVLGAIILPEPIPHEKIQAAWSYAIRYSAKGLDVPDYDAAIELLLQRHPSWKFIPGNFVTVEYDAKLAEQDKPD